MNLVTLPGTLLLLQAVISVHTELVAVPVTVTDARGQHVRGLSQDHFRVYEDGRQRPIAVFLHGDAPVTLGVIVDRSQSMRSKALALQSAVSTLLHSRRPDDELFAIGFSDDVAFALPESRPFTHDARALERALTAMDAGGRTALYDGVVAGLQHLQLGRATKSALVVISDGGDNASRETYAGVLALAQRFQVVVYGIGLLGASPIEEEEDAALLKRLSRDTGGVAHFPRSVPEMTAASSAITRDLREQYTLGFAPGAGSDRRFRKIEVKVSAPGLGPLRVRTRSGYTVQGDTAEHGGTGTR